jgi:hypothetical protein
MVTALSLFAIIKWVAIYCGPIAVVIAIYLKGLSAGKSSKQVEIDQAQKAQEARFRAAEAKNSFIEKERYDQVEKVRDASDDPAKLLKLWSEGPWGDHSGSSTPDSKTD